MPQAIMPNKKVISSKIYCTVGSSDGRPLGSMWEWFDSCVLNGTDAIEDIRDNITKKNDRGAPGSPSSIYTQYPIPTDLAPRDRWLHIILSENFVNTKSKNMFSGRKSGWIHFSRGHYLISSDSEKISSQNIEFRGLAFIFRELTSWPSGNIFLIHVIGNSIVSTHYFHQIHWISQFSQQN